MIMQTFTPEAESASQICLGKSPGHEKHKCQGLDRVKEAAHYVEPAGIWESTSTLNVIGIRKCLQSPTPSSTASDANEGHFAADPMALASALKQRARKQSNPNILSRSLSRHYTHAPTGDSDWEAWTLSSTGEFRSRPLMPDDLEDTDESSHEDDLFVAVPGPITRLGKRSVAVGFGNSVKIITLGKESFGGPANVENGGMDMGLGSYKHRARRGNGRKAQ